jgi:hypothetical protein
MWSFAVGVVRAMKTNLHPTQTAILRGDDLRRFRRRFSRRFSRRFGVSSPPPRRLGQSRVAGRPERTGANSWRSLDTNAREAAPMTRA